MTRQFDDIVIGASTAGLHAAHRLAQAGRRVAVFDRQKELNPARRTLIVTPAIREFLPDLPEKVVLHRTGTIALASPRAEAQVRLEDPDLIVERAALIRWLFGKARSAGARIFLGCRFTGFDSHSAQVHFHRHGPFSAMATQSVIGADGVNSRVAQAAGIPLSATVPIVQAEVDLPVGWDPDVTKVWFDVEGTRFFYWLIPESSTRGVAGLVGDDGAQIRYQLAAFLNRHEMKPELYQGAKVCMHAWRFRPWGAVGRVPILMVGDAAGQVKVTTVGGTVTGIAGAEGAVRSLLNGSSYGTELRAIRRELDLHALIRVLLERLDNAGYDLLLTLVSGNCQKLLERHNRDSMRRVVWQLPFTSPGLFRVVMRCLRFHPTKLVRPGSRHSLAKVSNPISNKST